MPWLRLGLLLAVSIGGASLLHAATPVRPAAASPRIFDPVAFFSGRTEGIGTLDEAVASPRSTHVTGFGSLRPDGLFLIDQTVEIEGSPATRRQWQLRQTAPGRFSGSLTDAKGPVTAAVTGNRIRIGYEMKGGMRVEQVLTLAPDGRSTGNSMKIRKFGIVVATVIETIRKL